MGPFIAGKAVQVPVWLALQMEEKDWGRTVAPAWLRSPRTVHLAFSPETVVGLSMAMILILIVIMVLLVMAMMAMTAMMVMVMIILTMVELMTVSSMQNC